MEKLKHEYEGVEIHWRSYQLRPPGSPPMSPELRQRIEASRPMFAARAQAEYGLVINQGPFGIDSRPSLILEKYAEAQGKGAEYHKAVENAYWQQGQSIEDPQVLKAALSEAGLDAEQYETALADPQYEAEVEADIQQAYAYGLSGVPAVVFNNRFLVMGAQPYEVFRQVMDKLTSGEAL